MSLWYIFKFYHFCFLIFFRRITVFTFYYILNNRPCKENSCIREWIFHTKFIYFLTWCTPFHYTITIRTVIALQTDFRRNLTIFFIYRYFYFFIYFCFL